MEEDLKKKTKHNKIRLGLIEVCLKHTIYFKRWSKLYM